MLVLLAIALQAHVVYPSIDRTYAIPEGKLGTIYVIPNSSLLCSVTFESADIIA